MAEPVTRVKVARHRGKIPVEVWIGEPFGRKATHSGGRMRRSTERTATMAIKQFVVDRYRVSIGQRNTATWNGVQIGIRGYVTCYGDDHRFIAYFLTDDSPVPEPTYIPANKVGAIFLSREEMSLFVDVVRNEKPLYAYLNSDRPHWNSIRTAYEPVGEEES